MKVSNHELKNYNENEHHPRHLCLLPSNTSLSTFICLYFCFFLCLTACTCVKFLAGCLCLLNLFISLRICVFIFTCVPSYKIHGSKPALLAGSKQSRKLEGQKPAFIGPKHTLALLHPFLVLLGTFLFLLVNSNWGSHQKQR